MAVTVELPTHLVAFPARCVLCRRAPEATRAVQVTKGLSIGLGHLGYFTTVDVQVPVCAECQFRIRVVRIGAWLVLVTLVVTAAVVVFLLGIKKDNVALAVTGAMMFLGLPYAIHSMLPQFLDAWQLGVAGITHHDGTSTVLLRFRDAEYAGEVQRLTVARREGRLGADEARFLEEQFTRDQQKRLPPRIGAALFMLGAVVVLAIDESDVREKGAFSPLIALLAPIVLVLAMAQTIDPQALVSIVNRRLQVSRARRGFGYLSVICAIVAGIGLLLHRCGVF